MARLGMCFALMGVVSLLAACDGGEGGAAEGGQRSGRLTLTGSSTIAPLASEIGRRFEQRHPNVRVDVQTGGSTQGVNDARRGLSDIGMVSRSLYEDESDLDSVTIGYDGICLIVHADNPVGTLSDDQVVDIFTGRVSNWFQAGGPEGSITVVNKAEGRSTLELFLAHFHLRSDQIRPSVVIGDNQHGIRTVVADRRAIGYVSIGTSFYERSRGTPIRLLPIGGVEPTLENVDNETYPLSRPLNLVTHGERSGLAEAFLAFAASSEVHDLVEAQYFVTAGE